MGWGGGGGYDSRQDVFLTRPMEIIIHIPYVYTHTRANLPGGSSSSSELAIWLVKSITTAVFASMRVSNGELAIVSVRITPAFVSAPELHAVRCEDFALITRGVEGPTSDVASLSEGLKKYSRRFCRTSSLLSICAVFVNQIS